MGNFKPVNTYDNNFVDVASSNWAMPSIKACYEYALMYGSSNTTFNPNGELTIAEALVMADRVHSIYNTGETAIFSGGNPWYLPYVSYAVNNGIIAQTDFSDVTKTATRAQMAYIFYNALPEEEFTAINSINSVPDVGLSHSYYHEILGLYNAGILTGSDTKGSFFPSNNIKRAEAAAIISRVVDTTLRKEFSLSESTSTPVTDSLTASQISEKCASAVAYVELYNANGQTVGSGSGFFIDDSGIFVTNYHVIEIASYARIMTTDGAVYNVLGVYDCDPIRDTAILQIDGDGFDFLEMDTSPLKAGQTIFTIGSPRGMDNTIADGLVSNTNRYLGTRDFIQYSAPISSGSSGGALINEYGKVVGITSSSIRDGENLNLAIPIHYINNLSRNTVTSLLDISDLLDSKYTVSLTLTSLILDKGEKKTVIVNCTPGTENMLVATTDEDSCIDYRWERIVSEGKAELTVFGEATGAGKLYVFFDDENLNATATLNATVTSNVVKPKNRVTYYSNGAPTYHSVTDISCITSISMESEEQFDGYVPHKDLYVYDYSEFEDTYYALYIKSLGWYFYDYSETEDALTLYYTKGDSAIALIYSLNTDSVGVLILA